MRTAVKWLSVLITLNAIIIVIFFIYPRATPVDTNTDFDVIYEDPEGDVIDDWGDYVEGYEDIDIVEMKSHKSEDNIYLILELKVKGEIRNSQDIGFDIELEGEGGEYYLEDDEYWPEDEWHYYTISYSNGFCSGHRDDGSGTDFLDTSIKNSDTLIIKVPLERLADFKTFNMWCEAYMGSDWDYMDSCPEYWGIHIQFTEPLDGSTVYNNCSIKGKLDTDDDPPFNVVEVQIDSLSPPGWSPAESSDNGTNWSYIWDTKNFTDGEHTVYARVNMGGMYYYDGIVLYVDQGTATKPRTAEVPTYQIGDRYKWTSTYPFTIPGDIINDEYEIVGLENITINGTNFETYVFQNLLQEEGQKNSLQFKSTYNRTYWLRKSDLALIKFQYFIEYREKNGKDEYNETEVGVTTYEYPKGYSWFPLKVGKQWNNIIFERGSYKCNFGNKTTSNYSSLSIENFQCLRIENITVPPGTFEVFIIACDDDQLWHSMDEFDMPNIENESELDYYLYYNGLIYYSPELGQIIKTDWYSWKNRFFYSGELVGYKYGNKSFEYKSVETTYNKYEESYPILIISLISINSLLASTMFISSTEIGKYGFFSAIAPFLVKRRKKRNYELGYNKGSVRGVIFAKPGVNYTSIKQTLKMPNGTLTYFLKVLESEGIIRSERDGFLKRFYPVGEKDEVEVLELTDIQKNIHNIIEKTPGISQKNILTHLDISQQKLNYHIQLMVKARLIRIARTGKRTMCYIIQEDS